MTELTVISPPDEEPVSLSMAKSYLRLGHSGEDDLVAGLIQSARARLEQAGGLALGRQRLQLVWRKWPTAMSVAGTRLLKTPVTEIISVNLLEGDTHEDYTDRFQLDCGRLRLRPWSVLPALACDAQVEVTFEAGFSNAASVPEDLKEALLRLIAAMYGDRIGAGKSAQKQARLPADVQAILDAHQGARL